MGVWIETNLPIDYFTSVLVTPFVGVWIETSSTGDVLLGFKSHPSWVCGLKLLLHDTIVHLISHTLRGCVD